MHIIDKGPSYPSQYRYALGRVMDVDGERVVFIEIDEPWYFHLSRCETESDDEIIELGEVDHDD